MLELIEFGKSLLDNEDLDPVYTVLINSNMSKVQLRKWLLAYWCFYHSGTASWITYKKDYWNAMMTAAKSKKYPRCPERRHFRGDNATKSVNYLSDVGLDGLFKPIDVKKPIQSTEVMLHVQRWVGFGPWISFKVADMLERVLGVPVVFPVEDVFLFDSPKVGASLAQDRYRNPSEATEDVRERNRWATEHILESLDGYLAPPTFDRPLGPQEAETILCKWKSHLNGHYEVGEDVEALRKSLARFGRVRLAQQLYRAGKRGKLW